MQPWFEVRRTIGIGVRWTVNTTVRRISPSSAVDVVRVPLLPGEDVTKADAIVENGHIVITVPRGETQVTWSSSLEPSAELSLVAPTERALVRSVGAQLRADLSLPARGVASNQALPEWPLATTVSSLARRETRVDV